VALMPACNNDLKNEGKGYPRTCAKCGLGKCLEEQRHENAALKTIAGLIQKLSYRDMKAYAEALTDELAGGKGNVDPATISEALLRASDNILTPPAALKMPAPAPGDYRR
jgi:hypothetical protein